ncbi:hypothetical protein JIR23_16005 [Bradyrhizobium diazoefficiens]|nr:hypothetical protein [Bradyrhizobium diazoefficiens]QQN67305.1 hypothetical protein JIR23_16005 [Bradyrhizobium diazoefficiens]
MKRILIGLIAVAVLAAGGWFGFSLYAKHRVTAEIEAALEQIRSRGGKASHGKIGFDLPSRTLTIEDIAVDPGQQSQTQIKIANVRATGVRQPDEGQFSADTLEVSELEITTEAPGPSPSKVRYTVPLAMLRNYSGPLHGRPAPMSDSPIDIYRFAIEQLAVATVSSITAPSIVSTLDTSLGRSSNSEVRSVGLSIQDIKNGRAGSLTIDTLAYVVDALHDPGTKIDKLSGTLSNIIASDINLDVAAATLDPQKANDENYRRMYQHVSAGPYVVTSTQGAHAQVERIRADEIDLQPSRFRPAEILEFLAKERSIPPTPAQAREMLEKFAEFCEGVRIGKAEINNSSIDMPQGQGATKLNSIRYDQDELAFEGLDGPVPHGHFRMERFALKSFSAVKLMRWAVQASDAAQKPGLYQALGIFRVLQGAEIKGIAAPYNGTDRLLTIDVVGLDWGQLVGPIPSNGKVVARFAIPTNAGNLAMVPLAAAGIDKLAIDLDLGAAWTESSGALALTPATVDLGNLARAQARFALTNVPRGMFTTDPIQAMAQAAQIETGAIELSLRDSGIVDLVVAQFARMQNVSRDAARQALVESIKAKREQVASANPAAGTAVDAIASFIETPGQTLSIKLSPRAKAPLMQLMQLLQTDPQSALAQFRIEASTGL